ncbi:MAG: ubiquinol oxidase subunit II [Myxococcaceae bacterium]
MKDKYKFGAGIFLALVSLSLFIFFLLNSDAAVLNPQGIMGLQQKDLMVTSIWLILIVVAPVIILTFVFAWRYRETNKKALYRPLWDKNKFAEIVWWGIPLLIIGCLSVMTWKASHELDPFKPIVSDKKTLIVEVVALEWKWLFIYPEQGIATINYVRFPENTPVLFRITADAPMNSFWIPRLGGQIYAMPGMTTKLYLLANEIGIFRGSSANFSGQGFSGMTFNAESTSLADFQSWSENIKKSSPALNFEQYEQIAVPSKNNVPMSYALEGGDFFYRILMNAPKVHPNRGHDVW